MVEWGKWSPLQIPDAIGQYVSSNGDGSDEDPSEAWDPEEWGDPETLPLYKRIIPRHMGHWMLFAAVVLMSIGTILWALKFFPGAYRNPDVLILTFWPASLLMIYVKGRNDGINVVSRKLDWSVQYLGNQLKVYPGRIVERFGSAGNYKFQPLKGISFGGFRLHWTKLKDLPKDRARLIAKAANEHRTPEDPAYYALPGALSVETSATVLNRVVATHGDQEKFHDGGTATDMLVTAPTYIDPYRAKEITSLLERYNNYIIPELMDEINTLMTLLERQKELVKREKDPRLEEIYRGIARLNNIVQRDRRRRSDDGRSDTDSDGQLPDGLEQDGVST